MDPRSPTEEYPRPPKTVVYNYQIASYKEGKKPHSPHLRDSPSRSLISPFQLQTSLRISRSQWPALRASCRRSQPTSILPDTIPSLFRLWPHQTVYAYLPPNPWSQSSVTKYLKWMMFWSESEYRNGSKPAHPRCNQGHRVWCLGKPSLWPWQKLSR